MRYDKKGFLLCILLWVVILLLALLFEGCRTTRQTETTVENFKDTLTYERHTSSFGYTLIDSLLSRWTIVAEGLEVHVSIPMANASLSEEMSPFTDDTTSASITCIVPPVVTIDMKANSIHIDGEQQGRTEVTMADSTELHRKATSQEYGRSHKKKKTTRTPAYLWWAAIPFILFLIYILRRWLKKK